MFPKAHIFLSWNYTLISFGVNNSTNRLRFTEYLYSGQLHSNIIHIKHTIIYVCKQQKVFQ